MARAEANNVDPPHPLDGLLRPVPGAEDFFRGRLFHVVAGDPAIALRTPSRMSLIGRTAERVGIGIETVRERLEALASNSPFSSREKALATVRGCFDFNPNAEGQDGGFGGACAAALQRKIEEAINAFFDAETPSKGPLNALIEEIRSLPTLPPLRPPVLPGSFELTGRKALQRLHAHLSERTRRAPDLSHDWVFFLSALRHLADEVTLEAATEWLKIQQ